MTASHDAYEIIKRALSVHPRGIMTDIDGTISRIAGHPDAATVEPEAQKAMAELASSLDLVAAVSGRAAEDARAMVGSDELVYAGNHGMEIWHNGSLKQSPRAAKHAPRIEELLHRIQSEIAIDGVYYENKGLTASIHVRGTSDPEAAEEAVVKTAGRIAGELDLRITRGRMVVEIRPPVSLSKGTAVIDLVDEYCLRGLVFFGDDMTDIDAFDALRARRKETGEHLYSIGVLRDQTPPEIRESTDAQVFDVDGVVDMLRYAANLVGTAGSNQVTE